MAASVNNIAATFAAARSVPTPSSSAAQSTQTLLASTSASTAALAVSSSAPARPISASWNPHSSLPRSRRFSLLSVYGPPGPLPLPRPPLPLLRSPSSTISAGRRLPSAPLSYLDSADSLRTTTLPDLTHGKKAVVLGVPGAFAPPWLGAASRPALTPESLINRAGEMRGRGVGAVAVVAANDVWVMRAWGEALGVRVAGVAAMSDPGAGLARAMGLAADMGGAAEGLGVRSEPYCLIAADGLVKALFLLHREDVGLDDVIRAL